MTDDGCIVIGAGGHGKVVLATLQAAGVRVAECWDDDPELRGSELFGVPVRGPIAARAGRHPGRPAVLSVGDNRVRRELVRSLSLDWRTAVHPRAWIHESVELGEGTVVFAGAVIQPDARLGRHAIVNTGATVDHDCRLGDFVHLAPGVHLAAGVSVEEGAFLGVGSAVIPGRSVGAWATVGAGAVVLEDVAPGVTVVGVPARPAGSSGAA